MIAGLVVAGGGVLVVVLACVGQVALLPLPALPLGGLGLFHFEGRVEVEAESGVDELVGEEPLRFESASGQVGIHGVRVGRVDGCVGCMQIYI